MEDGQGCDAVVIGAGAIGCAASFRLAQAGLSVQLLERGEPGAEASSAAAGILGAQMEAHEPGPFLQLQLASRALHPQLAEELFELTSIDVACKIEGVLEHAFDEAEREILRARFIWQQRAGLAVEWFEPQSIAASDREGPVDALASLLLVDDGQVDNRRLARALRIAAEKSGVQIVRAEALQILERGGRVSGVKIRAGEPALGRDGIGEERILECARVVVCAGSWSALLPGTQLASDSVRPVRGQMLALEIPNSLRGNARVLSGGGGYVVPRGDRALVGATVEEAGFAKATTAEGTRALREIAARLVPMLGTATMLESWSGLRPASRDGLPLLGESTRGPRGIFVCTGHYRSGILLTPISAAIIRDAILQQPFGLELAPFRPDRFI